jgi:serine/threonine protein kinase/tetratricopeptide (TPR) repeat protein
VSPLEDQPGQEPTAGSSEDPTVTVSPHGESAAHPIPPIGHYTLREKIGEGAFGDVYLAEQTEPVKRRVALKVLKAGMDTKAVLARFEAERQALALMDHPNIAKVYEAGETDRGLPYFVMELVKGEPITTYCDRHRLSIPERLELFIPVCNAVQHAHHKGIMHRDLKPSNILVMVSDEKPVPKVIDFGIAKARGAALTEKTLYTEQGQLIGTPEYMSPEQAEMGGLDVDTRTDIYSLGAVLYELLTGRMPFEAETLRGGGIARIQRVIRQEEPKKPSTKVSTERAGSMEVAKRRRTDVQRLARLLRGDLDWIVLRAMEKDRTRRYETANALALEIRRYLNDEPVLAGPPSAVYWMRKFAKRHRVGFAVVAIVLASLVFTAVESNRQRVAAQRARDESEAVTGFLSKMLAAVDPGKQGREVTVREILDKAAKTIGEEFAAQPLARARLMGTMGDVYRNLGHYAQARPLLESSLAIREKALGPDHPDVAQSLHGLAILLSYIGDYARARPLYERALAIREKALGPGHPEVAKSLTSLATLLTEGGDYAGARPLHERALAIREKALGPEHPDVAWSLNRLATLLYYIGDYAGARRLDERALAINEKALGPDHPNVAGSQSGLAAVLYKLGDYAGARRLYERALAINEKALGPDHPNVAGNLNNLAEVRRSIGDYAGARPLQERALAIWEKAFGPDHPAVAQSLDDLATLLREMGDLTGARPLYERALAIREKALGPNHPDVAICVHNLACLARDTGDYERSRGLFERAQQIWEKAFGPEHPSVAENLEQYGTLLRKTGEIARAESLEVHAKAIRAKQPVQAAR